MREEGGDGEGHFGFFFGVSWYLGMYYGKSGLRSEVMLWKGCISMNVEMLDGYVYRGTCSASLVMDDWRWYKG